MRSTTRYTDGARCPENCPSLTPPREITCTYRDTAKPLAKIPIPTRTKKSQMVDDMVYRAIHTDTRKPGDGMSPGWVVMER